MFSTAFLLTSAAYIPDFQAAPTVVVRAARILDVQAGKMLEKSEVVLAGDRIVSVGAQGSMPAGARLVDLGDATLLPGLIDMHTHLLFEISKDSHLKEVTEGPIDMALHGVKNARTTLRAGFTTVRDLGASGFSDVALMRAIDRGDCEGPRMFPAGHGIGITGGHSDATGFAPGLLAQGPGSGVADGPDECVKAVREQVKYGAKVIKIMATAGVLSYEENIGAQQLTLEEMKAIVDEAHRHGLRVAAHAHGTSGILDAIRAGVNSIEHGSLLTDEVIDAFVAQGTYLVPTEYLIDRLDMSILPDVQRKKAEVLFPLKEAGFKKALARGVKIAFGTDSAVYPHGENAREFAVYVKCGMKPIDAIRSATVNAADLLGVSDRGVITTGRLADLVAVPGNPLTDIQVLEHVSWVMKGGAVVTR